MYTSNQLFFCSPRGDSDWDQDSVFSAWRLQSGRKSYICRDLENIIKRLPANQRTKIRTYLAFRTFFFFFLMWAWGPSKQRIKLLWAQYFAELGALVIFFFWDPRSRYICLSMQCSSHTELLFIPRAPCSLSPTPPTPITVGLAICHPSDLKLEVTSSKKLQWSHQVGRLSPARQSRAVAPLSAPPINT